MCPDDVGGPEQEHDQQHCSRPRSWVEVHHTRPADWVTLSRHACKAVLNAGWEASPLGLSHTDGCHSHATGGRGCAFLREQLNMKACEKTAATVSCYSLSVCVLARKCPFNNICESKSCFELESVKITSFIWLSERPRSWKALLSYHVCGETVWLIDELKAATVCVCNADGKVTKMTINFKSVASDIHSGHKFKIHL